MGTLQERRPGTSLLSLRLLLVCIALLLSFCTRVPSTPTVEDDLGRAVALPQRVERIVTLAPNVTEIVYAIGAGGKVVGVDDASDHPVEARAVPKVGGMQPNIEKIATLQPDLVLASTEGNHPNLASALAAAGIPLYVVRTDRLEEITGAMQRVGRILDVSRAGDSARELEAAIAAQRRSRRRPPRVMFVVWTDPLYVAGRNTFTDDLFALTGATNAVEVSGWPQYSLESLVASPPELMLYPRGALTPEQIETLRSRVPELSARVVAVDEDVFQRPGPRVAEAAARLNAILDAEEQRVR